MRKEAIHHADHLNKALQHQLEAELDKKADASTVGREGQSSRQQLSELWAEAESAREGLEQVKGDVQQVQGQVVGLHDKLAITKVSCRVTFAKLAQSSICLSSLCIKVRYIQELYVSRAHLHLVHSSLPNRSHENPSYSASSSAQLVSTSAHSRQQCLAPLGILMDT